MSLINLSNNYILLNLSNNYILYLNKIGASLEAIKIEIPPFAENCTKVINGSLVASNAKEFKQQLKEVRDAAGPWRVELIESLPCMDQKIAVVRYDILSENAGGFQVIAILRYNNDELLQDVTEVYHPLTIS